MGMDEETIIKATGLDAEALKKLKEETNGDSK